MDYTLLGVATAGCFWSGLCMLRTELHMPRDEPIRFNRARRKVYAYQYKRDWRRPFTRSAWGVKISIYDWENLRAEACEAYGALGTGGSIQTINLSVVKPGTREFTDRFIFKHNIYDGEEAWSMTQLFMHRARKPCQNSYPFLGTETAKNHCLMFSGALHRSRNGHRTSISNPEPPLLPEKCKQPLVKPNSSRYPAPRRPTWRHGLGGPVIKRRNSVVSPCYPDRVGEAVYGELCRHLFAAARLIYYRSAILGQAVLMDAARWRSFSIPE